MSQHTKASFCLTCGHQTDASGTCHYERPSNYAQFLSDVADRVRQKLADERSMRAVPIVFEPED